MTPRTSLIPNEIAPVLAELSEANKEFMPAGQGVGAIHELIPAGDIVRSMMAEAERTIDHLISLRG